MRGAKPFLLVVALATSLLGACASGAGGSGSSPSANGVGNPIVWGACDPPGVSLQCARIRVPLDWDRPNGRTISLALIRHLASKPQERIGTMFINPGGPGAPGIGLLQGDPEGIDALGGGRFDVVSWDPRGTNASTRVKCFRSQRSESRFWAGVSIPTSRAASARFEDKVAALARRCGQVSGWLLPHISTADTARDLDHLRVLMGEAKLTYIGLSYGTFLGQTYANMFPDRIRAMLLDGLVDPTSYSKDAEARVAGQVASSDEVYGKFLSLCESAGPERCALAGGGETASERFGRLVARLKRAPIPAPGVRPPLSSTQKLTYVDMLVSQFNPLRAPSTWPVNAANLAAALRGDGSVLASAAAGFTAPSGWAGALISSAISCADAPAHRKLRAWPQLIHRFHNVSRLQGSVLGWWLWAPCAAWPVRGEDNYRGPWTATTPNPILLINQRYDPNTGYANAVHVNELLGNSILLTHEGYGHLSFQDPSTCIDKATFRYLTELVTPPPGTVCQSDQQPFDPGFG
jgi:pimeloyl-ACP methyl ester carboxylesterase